MISKNDYLKIKHFIHNEGKEFLANNNIVGAFEALSYDSEAKDILYNFLTQNLNVNPLSYVREIPKDFFKGVSGVAVVPKETLRLQPRAFAESKLTEVKFEDSCVISALPENCFLDSKDLKNITMSKKVEKLEIGKDALFGCDPSCKLFVSAKALEYATENDTLWLPDDEEDSIDNDAQMEFYYTHIKKIK